MAEHGRMVIVASFGRPLDAHLARMELEAEGIQAFILDEHAISANPFYAPALGGVKVAVREEDAARARAILGKEPG